MRFLFILVFLLGNSIYSVSYGQVDVIMNHNDLKRTGWNNQETILTTENVSNGNFGKIFTRDVDDEIYAQPLVLSNFQIGGGIHNIVIVATVNNSLYVFDADDAEKSTPYWHVNLTYDSINYRPVRNTDMTGACTHLPQGYSDFSGNIGIVGTPAIDRATNTVYVVARSKSKTGTEYVQYLHAIDLVTGAEKIGSPRLISATYPGTGEGNVNGIITFDAQKNNQRAGLLLLNNVLYICWASHCSWGPYHGWMMGYDASTLEQKYVYNTTPNGQYGGIWMSGQPPSVDDDGNLLITSGNGTTGQNGNANDTINRSSSLIKLTPELKVLDFFTPANYDYLNKADRDYGINGPLIIPGTHLSLSGSKDGGLYLVDNNNMGGTRVYQDDVLQRINFGDWGTFNTKHLHGSPVYFKDNNNIEYIYGWAQGALLKQIPFDRTTMRFDTVNAITGHAPLVAGYMPGGILSLSSNESQSGTGILWASHVASGNANNSVVPGLLQAFDATDVTKVLWNSSWNAKRDSIGKFAKFVPPTIANGKVYMATFSNKLNVYGVFPPDTSECISIGTGLLAEYFTNISSTSTFPPTATITKTEPTINFNWEAGGPQGISVDSFMAKFSGRVQSLEAGKYTFYVTSNDGYRLWVNDQLLIDKWTDSVSSTEDSASINLNRCKRNYIKLEYYENIGNAFCILKWSGPDIIKQVIPSSQLYPADTVECISNGTGLFTEYFTNSPYTAPFPSTATITKTEPTVNFNWGMSGPAGISVNSFKARFSGQVQVLDSGKHTFYVTSDDGYRLWVNDQLLIDKWIDKSATEDSATITLSGCTKNKIKLEYYDNRWDAVCILKWKGPGFSKQVIPSTKLYPIYPPVDTAECIYGGTGLLAEYFSNSSDTANFPNNPTVTKIEPTINFDWGSGAPQGISVDSFKARFSGRVQSLDAGNYTFYVSSNDGYRLWVNDQLLLDKWTDSLSSTEDSATIILERCNSNYIRLEYYEKMGNAFCFLKWSGPGFIKQFIPTILLYPADSMNCISNGTGLITEYFTNSPPSSPFPDTPTITNTETTVNFNWGMAGPPGISADSFKVRFSGQVQSLDSGAYTFYVTSDDGYRLWINEQLLIDKWIDKSSSEDSATIVLSGCTKNRIKLEYYDSRYEAVCILKWSGPGITKQVIPGTQFYPVLPPKDTAKCIGDGTGLIAEYFSNSSDGVPFPDNATITQIEPNVNFNWEMGGPPGISINTFKARFKGQIMSRDSGAYTFYINSDDGYRLWVDNQLIIDQWIDKSATEDSVKITLAGCTKYNINLEYYENGGDAVCILKWSGPGTSKQVIPSIQFYPEYITPIETSKCIGNGKGLLAEYFSNTSPTAPFPDTATVTRIEPIVNFNWEMDGPPGISVDSFKTRFLGQVQSIDSGAYTFYVTSDDGYRLWVDNQLIIDKWIDKSATEDSMTITLSECTKYNIKLEYFERRGNAVCILKWSGPGISKEVVPSKRLYSEYIPPVDTVKCGGNGTGLLTEYFSNTSPTAQFPDTASIIQIEPTINFDWGIGGPSGISVDSFKARFSGQLLSLDSGAYTFYISSDDGYRLWVNNELILNKWIDKSAIEDSVTINLSECTKYNIKLEYYENGYTAVCILKWSGPDLKKQVIPAKQLYPDDPPDDFQNRKSGRGNPLSVQVKGTIKNEDSGSMFNKNNELVIYPNPNGINSLTISIEEAFPRGAEISIYNLMGQRIMTNSFSGAGIKTKQITLPINLKRGIYILKLITFDKIYSSKFIVL